MAAAWRWWGQADVHGVDAVAQLGEQGVPVVVEPAAAAQLFVAHAQVVVGHVAQGDTFDEIGMPEDAEGVLAGNTTRADDGETHFGGRSGIHVATSYGKTPALLKAKSHDWLLKSAGPAVMSGCLLPLFP